MQINAVFEKVSYDQFYQAVKEGYPKSSDAHIKALYNKIELPKRATAGSAGYDFFAPYGFRLGVGEQIKIPTGIRAIIDDGWFLACFPRSGLGFKYRLQFNNTVGIIDSDYSLSDNEGHIFAKLTNDGLEGKTVVLQKGQAFMQGIFLPYGIIAGDTTTEVRNGGMGSTDKK